MIGKTLGHYQITSQLGKGGMGEVYQAKDQKLGRDVAIKVLPDEFAKDAERVARFKGEAKVLASLNHPNIAAIYGLEESDGTNFLVLELVEGETLADRIKSGAIPAEEVLKLALQIAEALEASHEKGVIHRDLKPANIKITPDNKVKVLDFGLAKAFAGQQFELNLSNSPTLSNAATQQGVILGTAAYMSPEQARGKSVDNRTDIWAFGCVLFEMLTGQATFSGRDVTEILAAILRDEPDWSKLPANLHWRIREMLYRCLEKEARDRCSGISDGRVEIQKVLANPQGAFAHPSRSAASLAKSKMPWLIAAAMGLIALATILYGLRSGGQSSTPPPNAIPVVVLMDTDAPNGVYDPSTMKSSGTNADDISNGLRDLPVALHKEMAGATWNREDQILKQIPDLIVIHLSVFVHALVRDFQFPSGAAEPKSAEGVAYTQLGPVGRDKLETFLGYVAKANHRTRFLVYSRMWPEASQQGWRDNLARRFPEVGRRLFTVSVRIKDGTASFRDPETIAEIKGKVCSILNLGTR